jgi:hypothetical protein
MWILQENNAILIAQFDKTITKLNTKHHINTEIGNID